MFFQLNPVLSVGMNILSSPNERWQPRVLLWLANQRMAPGCFTVITGQPWLAHKGPGALERERYLHKWITVSSHSFKWTARKKNYSFWAVLLTEAYRTLDSPSWAHFFGSIGPGNSQNLTRHEPAVALHTLITTCIKRAKYITVCKAGLLDHIKPDCEHDLSPEWPVFVSIKYIVSVRLFYYSWLRQSPLDLEHVWLLSDFRWRQPSVELCISIRKSKSEIIGNWMLHIFTAPFSYLGFHPDSICS